MPCFKQYEFGEFGSGVDYHCVSRYCDIEAFQACALPLAQNISKECSHEIRKE